jgi:type II restriction enzyme
MISRIQSDSVPVLMLLERSEAWKIKNLTAIHPLFLTPEVIVKRKPLSSTARRAGWTGCNSQYPRQSRGLDYVSRSKRLERGR